MPKSKKSKGMFDDPNWADTFRQVCEQIVTILKSKETAFGTDRAIAIMLAAYLEQTLEIGIAANLKNNDTATLKRLVADRGPLASLSNKIEMAYALGAIDEPTRGELNAIRRIRNDFAHTSFDISFETDFVAVECCKLNSMRLFGLDVANPEPGKQPPTPRQNFVGSAVLLLLKVMTDLLTPLSRLAREKANASGDPIELEAADKAARTAEAYTAFFPIVRALIKAAQTKPAASISRERTI